MTFHFKQDCDGAGFVAGTAFLDADEIATLRPCPQCDQVPAYGADGPGSTYYFVECPRCGLRILSGTINPRSIHCLRNAVRYHKRALQSAINNWNERANAKGSPHWPKIQPLSDLPPEVDV